ncbi:glycosyltransferase family 4 protein [Sphingobacterium sp. Mn56C]|uniref:glycosyltransferase family 4 protein n=1 Tax=Sphingobacterium sp. Mn56C TaxID=3395261 RepID=UPI003BEB84E0
MKKKIKVLHVVSISFSIKYFIGNQFFFFKKRGYEFHVACTDSEDLRQLADHFKFTPFPVPILRNIAPLQDIKSIWELRNYIKKEKFDIVIAHSPKGGLIGMIASYLAGVKKRIFIRHGLVFETSSGLKKALLINVERLIGLFSTKIVNVSPSVEKVATELRLNLDSKNTLLGKGTYNGVNIDVYKADNNIKYDNTKVIGFVGRLAKDKGLNELIEAWKMLIKEFNNIKLLLVGPIDERDPMELSVLEYMKNEKTIEFTGGVSDTSNYYNKMDVFVLPSLREGFPTVVLEASASELPIITTKATGCVDSIIENETGIFVDYSAQSLYNGIKYYLDNPLVAKNHGINGRSFVKNNFAEEILYTKIQEQLL